MRPRSPTSEARSETAGAWPQQVGGSGSTPDLKIWCVSTSVLPGRPTAPISTPPSNPSTAVKKSCAKTSFDTRVSVRPWFLHWLWRGTRCRSSPACSRTSGRRCSLPHNCWTGRAGHSRPRSAGKPVSVRNANGCCVWSSAASGAIRRRGAPPPCSTRCRRSRRAGPAPRSSCTASATLTCRTPTWWFPGRRRRGRVRVPGRGADRRCGLSSVPVLVGGLGRLEGTTNAQGRDAARYGTPFVHVEISCGIGDDFSQARGQHGHSEIRYSTTFRCGYSAAEPAPATWRGRDI